VAGSFQVVHRDSNQEITLEVIARSLVVRVAQDVGCALRVLKILQLVDMLGWFRGHMDWSLGIHQVRFIDAYHRDAWRYDSLPRLFDDL
jgi:hypothetical protein